MKMKMYEIKISKIVVTNAMLIEIFQGKKFKLKLK